MNPSTITILVELEVCGESLTGRARVDGGPDSDFSGRLGLLAAIDDLVDRRDAQAGTSWTTPGSPA